MTSTQRFRISVVAMVSIASFLAFNARAEQPSHPPDWAEWRPTAQVTCGKPQGVQPQRGLYKGHLEGTLWRKGAESYVSFEAASNANRL